MNNREEVKEIVRQIDALLMEEQRNDNKISVSADLLLDILKVLVSDYAINKSEL